MRTRRRLGLSLFRRMAAVTTEGGSPLLPGNRLGLSLFRRMAAVTTEGGSPLFADEPIDPAALPSFRAEYFPYSGPYPWLDRPDAEEQVEARLRAGELTEDQAELCRYWSANGYVIIEGAIEPETLDAAWAAYEEAIARGEVVLPTEKKTPDDPWPGRYLNPHLKVPGLCPVMRHPAILERIALLIGREPLPYQTITSHKGSEQKAHSDSIHMTTYPLGYLTAAWIAFEDIHPDSGPLIYYPGSHRLPYLFSHDVGIMEDDFRRRGYATYFELYEPRIQQMIESHRLEPRYFHARKGDVLIWHANLIHGGSPRRDPRHSRKALVSHYFVDGAIAYHDLASSPTGPFAGTCLLREQES